MAIIIVKKQKRVDNQYRIDRENIFSSHIHGAIGSLQAHHAASSIIIAFSLAVTKKVGYEPTAIAGT
jgi:hypothetical protein